jgi:hypothetical protein
MGELRLSADEVQAGDATGHAPSMPLPLPLRMSAIAAGP